MQYTKKPKFFITILYFAFASCSNLKGCKDFSISTAEKNRRNIICFVDLSGSVSNNQRKSYIKAIEQILKNMGLNDRLICYPIDKGSYSDPIKILNEDFKDATPESITFSEAFDSLNKNTKDSILPFIRENEGLGDEDIQASRRERYVSYILPYVEKRLNNIRPDKKFSGKSDIIYAIINSKKDIEAEDAYGLEVSNYLIFLSDMIHDDGTIDFDKHYGISRDEGETVLQNLKSTNLIPNLQKASIIVLGKSQGKYAKTPEAEENIKRFWEEYFSSKYANGGSFYYESIDAISDIPKLLAFQKN